MGHFPPRQALQFLQTHPQALFIDCRSEMEYLFVGHPVGALHVPWNDSPDWAVNPAFVAELEKLAPLERAGWRFEGLPWEQC